MSALCTPKEPVKNVLQKESWDTAEETDYHLDMEFHTELGNPQWDSPSPVQQCFFHALQSDRPCVPLCHMKALQTVS